MGQYEQIDKKTGNDGYHQNQIPTQHQKEPYEWNPYFFTCFDP
jgi:hypothetical protein